MAAIAIIAYGSLVWDSDCLGPYLDEPWRAGQGPRLKVEFSRISPKRKMGLVLVIDEAAPAPCATAVARSTRHRLDDAIADLARRERTQASNIGVATGDGVMRSRHGDTGVEVARWLATTRFDAAIWTDLDSNFADHCGQAFSPAAGLAHLKSLTGDSLVEAWRYITLAPVQTQTPFRAFLGADPWWNGLDFGERG